jgi:hypothetical protein
MGLFANSGIGTRVQCGDLKREFHLPGVGVQDPVDELSTYRITRTTNKSLKRKGFSRRIKDNIPHPFKILNDHAPVFPS